MPVRPLSRTEVRGLDARAAQQYGLPTIALMENAGSGAASWLRQRFGLTESTRILALCGPGNNGGDGGVVIRRLDAWGFREARALWLADPERLTGDAATQFQVLAESGLNERAATEFDPDWLRERLSAVDWIIDGLLGTGLTRPVAGPMQIMIEAANESGKPILALDLPSGLDCDAGVPLGTAIVAKATATFVAWKQGFLLPSARPYLGEVETIEIGLPGALLREFAQGDK